MINLMFQMQIQFMTGVILLLLLRPLLAKFPRIISYSLWCILFLRLLCPFSLPIEQAPWSVQNMAQVVKQKSSNLTKQEPQQLKKTAQALNEATETEKRDADTENHLTSPSKDQSDPSALLQKQNKAYDTHQTKTIRWNSRYRNILLSVWLTGVLLYLAYFFPSFHKFKTYAQTARECPDRKGVYESEHTNTPYVFGIIRKRIILPRHLEENEKEYIICHEQMHIHRKDDLLKWITFLLTAIYWFQPFVWIAAYFMEQDMEMSCDEAVIRKMGENIKKEYAQSLLSFAQGRKGSVLPLTFASGSVKKRIHNVLHTTHLKLWMFPIITIIILCLALLVFTAQSPERKAESKKVSLEEHSERKVESKKISLEERIEEKLPEAETHYEYKVDITHDGKADTIIFDLTAILDESKITGEEKTVVVKSATGQEIASYTADTVHGGWNGIYIYSDDTGDYLVNWRPIMYQGIGNYQLKVYSLQEDGTENILFEKTYQFDLNPGNFHFNPKSYQKYIDKVNQYLQKSYVIIDTDQGEAKYSTNDSKRYGFYDGSEVLESYRDINR